MKGVNSFEIRLRNAEGIPIVEIGGELTKTALRAVEFTLEKLASAGHFNVVVNVEKAQAANWGFLSGLADVIRKFRSHYGAVDLVAAQDRIQQLVRIEQLSRLFRFSRSEGQAISRIKGLSRQPDGITDTNARLA